jgi:hypothetical protein
MAAGYVHVDLELTQSSKKPGAPCGDVFDCERTAAATTMVCADGIGSGIRARIAAEMCVSRVMGLLRSGFSLRKTVASVVSGMERSRDPSRPFAAFSVVRILNDGLATILSYEAPSPILLNGRHASLLPHVPVDLGGAFPLESTCFLEPGDALVIMSDGITQAGLGSRLTLGWETEGVLRYINDRLGDGILPKELPQQIHREARQLWEKGGDDCTVAAAICRRGQIVNILTGPATRRSDDSQVVRRFIQSDGIKIVCGGTTAEIVARILKQKVCVEQQAKSLVAPPRYSIAGVDLVTEGAVTLNQVYNVLDEDIRNLTEDSGVTEMCALLQIADRVNIFFGGAKNAANADISFRQRGILDRSRVIPLIVDRLESAGKLVVVESI